VFSCSPANFVDMMDLNVSYMYALMT